MKTSPVIFPVLVALSLMAGCSSLNRKSPADIFCGMWRISLTSPDEAATSDRIVVFEPNGITTQGYMRNGVYTASMTARWTVQGTTMVVIQPNGTKEIRPFIFDDPDHFRILGEDSEVKAWSLRVKD
ncbi:MAG TPA: hypothetical protein PK297_08950 [Spirochaetota bacterium]|nr:hypothetical protein [Spirochaetota bacterium]